MEKMMQLVAMFPEKFQFLGPTEPSLVELAEFELGTKLSTSFKDYLRTWGVLEFDSSEFYGIIGPDFVNSSVPDFVWFNKLIRKTKGFPKHLVVFRNVDGVIYFCLDTSKFGENGECPVVVWDAVSDEIEEQYDLNFGEFLYECAEEALEE
jgi:hypothetical protein